MFATLALLALYLCHWKSPYTLAEEVVQIDLAARNLIGANAYSSDCGSGAIALGNAEYNGPLSMAMHSLTAITEGRLDSTWHKFRLPLQDHNVTFTGVKIPLPILYSAFPIGAHLHFGWQWHYSGRLRVVGDAPAQRTLMAAWLINEPDIEDLFSGIKRDPCGHFATYTDFNDMLWVFPLQRSSSN